MAGFQDGFLILQDYDITTNPGDNDDVDVNGSFVAVDTANDMDAITGFVGVPDGHAIMLLLNSSPSNTLILKYDTGSTPPYRIFTPDGLDLTVPPFYSVWLLYVESFGWTVQRFV